jgi:hypothetical protein
LYLGAFLVTGSICIIIFFKKNTINHPITDESGEIPNATINPIIYEKVAMDQSTSESYIQNSDL